MHEIKKYIQNVGDTSHILVGLSGGPDSVFLLHFLKKLKIKLSAAHLNHGWRKSAKIDELFCKNLCKKLKIDFFSAHAKDLKISVKNNGSLEEVGRKMRRYFLEQIKEKIGADYIALAHHQQDQQETFFIRIMRGCSLDGLVSMRPVQKPYIRPLLKTSKTEILKYLKENKIEYVVDPTNNSDKFLRNRVRKYLLPQLEKIDHRFNKKFATTLENLQKENEILQKLTKENFSRIFSTQPDGKQIGNKKIFCALNKIFQKRLIVKWLCEEKVPFSPSNAYFCEITRFIENPRGGKHNLNNQWSIHKKQSRFWIEKCSI
jgi:tRNA(Ile)-lysidine synthase